jgi:hypothetical protein
MAKHVSLLMLMLLSACGGGASSSALTVALSAPPARDVPLTSSFLSMMTGETQTFLLLAVGAEGRPAQFGSEALPGFATLGESELTFAPRSTDAGTYFFTLTAVAGRERASTHFELVVQQAETTAPLWTITGYPLLSDNTQTRAHGCPSATTCTIFHDPIVFVQACDPQGTFIIDGEVVPHGQAFTGRPSNSFTSSAHPCAPGPPHDTEYGLSFEGLLPGRVYDFALRVSNPAGIAAVPDQFGQGTTLDQGWVVLGSFEQGPCAAGTTCACVPTDPASAQNCNWDSDCCSGRCSAFSQNGVISGTCE